jgi:hypothetical protein
MQVICKTNDLSTLHKELLKFAFMQDEKGIVPLTPGQKYTVYGRKENRFGEFVFVVGDDEKLPWWMPKGLFEEVEVTLAPHWKTEKYPSAYGGTEVVSAPTLYFNHEDDIEDGTKAGYEAFAAIQKLA